MQHTEQQYQKLLRHFTGKHLILDWLAMPFVVGDKSVSSNSHQLIATPLKINADDYSSKTIGIYPFSEKAEFIHLMKYDFLEEKIDGIPKIHSYEEIECGACNGIGEVEYSFEYKSEEYTEKHYCPICNGDGYAQGKYIGKILDRNAKIKLGTQYFYAKYIADILFVCETLGVNEIKIAKQESQEQKPLMIKISDCDMLVMPILYNDEELSAIIKLD